jgi:hypothetical protein
MHQILPVSKCDVRRSPEILDYDMQQKGVKQIQDLGQKQILRKENLLIVVPHSAFISRHLTLKKRRIFPYPSRCDVRQKLHISDYGLQQKTIKQV